MRITHFTPGTGHFHCGSCLRDNALVSALKRRGHDLTMVPLYLPFVLDGEPATKNDRVFLGGMNMYLQQKLPITRMLPGFISRRLDSPTLLRWLSTKGDMTDAHGLGAMTVTALRGESGRQQREFERLVEWAANEPRPDVVCISNIMLVGMAKRMKETLGAPIVCTLQGEAPFLDSLPEPYRSEAWSLIGERMGEIDAFVPVSRYYGEVVRERVGFDAGRMHVVHNGIAMEDLPAGHTHERNLPPTVGYLARMCEDKGLHTLVEAFVVLRDRMPDARLHVAGVMLSSDEPYVAKLRSMLDKEGCGEAVTFSPNVDRQQKVDFLQSISVLSVPATYGESFGLFVIEALASGVPVVQPRHGAFPEVLELTGGGRLCEPDDALSLADELYAVLNDATIAAELAIEGARNARERFTADRMALEFEHVCKLVAS